MIDLHVVERLRGMQRVRATRLEQEGFTPKQAAFLLMVLEHSGVFVERQYCAYAGITHGQKTHDFLRRLTGSGLAREVRPGALHRGRLYHVRHKRLYAAIGQADNRNRRPAPIGALASRLMLLDLVLDDPSRLWLGTSRDKRLYFTELDTQRRLDDVDLPHLRYGAGRDKVLRLFPDKLPIGTMTQDPDTHVFTYLVTRRDPVDFRAFLQRHHWLLCFGGPWTLRVALPRPFHGLEGRYRGVVREELFSPMELSAAAGAGVVLRGAPASRVRPVTRPRPALRRGGAPLPDRRAAPSSIASTSSAASRHSPASSPACCWTSCSGRRRAWSSCRSSGSTCAHSTHRDQPVHVIVIMPRDRQAALGSHRAIAVARRRHELPGPGRPPRAPPRLHDALSRSTRSCPEDQELLVEYKFFEPAFYATDLADWGSARWSARRSATAHAC